MLEQLLAFIVASFIVIVVPGPDMMLLLRNAARAGKVGATWTAAGIMAGIAILTTAASLGITALFTAVPILFNVVRIAGGMYLVYLGIGALRTYIRLRKDRTNPPQSKDADTRSPAPAVAHRAASFHQGLFCNLVNPKAAVFYLSLFPQFNLAPLPPLTQHVVLAALF